MKRITAIFLSVLVLSCGLMQAQGKKEDIVQVTISTKKDKLIDVQNKTVKVVLGGDDLCSLALRDAVKNSWWLSPYEFCGMEDFRKLRSNDNFYFLYMVTRDDGINYLRLAKGGSDDIDSMLEAVTFPFCPSDGFTGREGSYMPALLDIMQEYVERSLSDGFKNVSTMVTKKPKDGLKLIFDEYDLGPVDGKTRGKCLEGRIYDSTDAADAIHYGTADTAVGYTIFPVNASTGVCYKMLLDARTHDLYYFRKHKIASPEDKGFLKKDIRTLTKGAE